MFYLFVIFFLYSRWWCEFLTHPLNPPPLAGDLVSLWLKLSLPNLFTAYRVTNFLSLFAALGGGAYKSLFTSPKTCSKIRRSFIMRGTLFFPKRCIHSRNEPAGNVWSTRRSRVVRRLAS